MQKIIGLDIGSYSIKAVEISNNFKSYEISQFYENIIPSLDEIEPESVVPVCLQQLFSENNITADRIVAAMPGQYISSRILTFGFSDSRKIAAAVFSEIEDVVPFPLEEMIIDHQILGNQDGKTFVLVVMTRKKFLGSFLDHLQKINIDPKLVEVDSLSFYNLSPYLEMEENKCYGIVDVGHEKTSVCLVQNGMLRMFRAINLAGRYSTEFLSRDLLVSYNEAQKLKHSVSQVLVAGDEDQNLSGEARIVAEKLTASFNSLLKELGRTLYAFKSWEKAPVEKIYLSGGSSYIKNFDILLSRSLGVPTELDKLAKSKLQLNQSLTKHLPQMAQGISIGLRAVASVKRHSYVNLRKDEFAYVQDYEAILKSTNTIFKVIGFALLLLSLSYGAFYYIYSNKIKEIASFYRKEFLESFPDMKKKYASDQYPFAKLRSEAKNMMKDKITARKAATDGFIKINSDSGALVALQKISAGIPLEVKINVVEYSYTAKPDGSGLLRIKVEADSFQTLTSFKKELGQIVGLKDVEEKSSDSKPGSDLKVALYEINYVSIL